MGCVSSVPKNKETEEVNAENVSSTLAEDPQFQSDNRNLHGGHGGKEASTEDTAAFTSSNTDNSQASILENAAPGNVVFEIDGKRVDLVVATDEVDMSLEPDYEPPPLPPPDIEEARCRALKGLGLDYQSEEPSLNFITKICGDLFPGTVSFIIFMDSDYTYVKSSCPPMLQKVPADRRVAVASWMLLSLKPEMLVVEDMSTDRRFRRNPFVTAPPNFRSCAAVPLLEKGGHRIGILGVIGFAPQKFSGEMRSLLCNLADMAMKEINLLSEHYRKLERKVAQGSLESSTSTPIGSYMDSSKDCILLLDMSQPGWQILLSNQKWIEATGVAGDSESSSGFWDIFQLATSRKLGSATGEAIHFAPAIQARSNFEAVMAATVGSKEQEYFVSFKPATSEQVDNSLPRVKIPAVAGGTPSRNSAADERPFYLAILKPRRRVGSSPRPGGLRGLEDSMAEAEEPPIPGLRLGALLGRGSFGRVHAGEWSSAPGSAVQRVAVKVIRMALTWEEEKREGEHMEAIIGQQLTHPNVVSTLQSGYKRIKEPALQMPSLHSTGSVSGGSDLEHQQHAREMIETWIVLELCTEGSLQEAIDRADYKIAKDGRWVPDVKKCIQTATEIASAMAFLHSKDILHSDLSSSNVLLTRHIGGAGSRVVAKVSDFGLSRVQTTQKTIATMTYGTVTHMPPELLLENRLSKAADVYAFGVLLWELLTGKRPWGGLRHAQIVAMKIKGLPAGELQWPPGSNKTIKAISQQCMQSDPHDRPSFEQVVDMLKPLQSQQV